MRKLLVIPLFALAAGCMQQTEDIALSPQAESQLAVALEGRTRGQATSCVSSRGLGGNRSIGEGAILFETATGGTIYINRPAGGCPRIRMGTALVVRSTTTQLCRGDIADVVDPATGVNFGGCALGDFTPYTRN